MTQDIVEQWTELSRRDDLFNHMVPSDVRMMLGEISRARAERDEYIRQCKEALHDAAEAKGDAHKHWVDKVNAEAERDEAKAENTQLHARLGEIGSEAYAITNPANRYPSLQARADYALKYVDELSEKLLTDENADAFEGFIRRSIELKAENVRLRKDCRAWSDVATQLCADHCDAAYDLMGKYRKALGGQS